MNANPSIQSAQAINYKRSIARSFNRAAHTYNKFAHFQQQVMTKLLALKPLESYSNILDLGSGTGNALSLLNPMADQVVALDLSFAMLQESARAHPQNSMVCADAEALPFGAEKFALIFSNLAIQWSQNPRLLGQELNRVLKAKGYFLVSTLCQGSLLEIEQTWLGIDNASHINQYPIPEKILQPFLDNGFILHNSVVEPMTMWFDSPELAVYSLKKIGASMLVNQKATPTVTPTLWKKFLAQYNEMRQEQGIPLTYHVAYFLLQKS